MQQNIQACVVELKMMADSEGREAATAYRPQAKQGQEQPVAILDCALLVAVDGQYKRCVHELDAEVERFARRDEAIVSILGQFDPLCPHCGFFDREASNVAAGARQALYEALGDWIGNRSHDDWYGARSLPRGDQGGRGIDDENVGAQSDQLPREPLRKADSRTKRRVEALGPV
jgi:hypothetical protein